MNTRIDYLYRDGDNYKVQNTCVVAGAITKEQIESIIDSLEDGEYFIPRLVGMPEKKFDTYDPQSDHPYFELGKYSFSPTDAEPTLTLNVGNLVELFCAHKGNWKEYGCYRTPEETPGGYNPVAVAYSILLQASQKDDADLGDAMIAIEECIGYLGEALAD